MTTNIRIDTAFVTELRCPCGATIGWAKDARDERMIEIWCEAHTPHIQPPPPNRLFTDAEIQAFRDQGLIQPDSTQLQCEDAPPVQVLGCADCPFLRSQGGQGGSSFECGAPGSPSGPWGADIRQNGRDLITPNWCPLPITISEKTISLRR